ncbi:sugar-binding domain-containing protein [Nesterenkonia sandarakina]|uniref:DNA-binding transcriptional regulator LsrR (DeoR family) n=1 Tax=Nesterenkonia sandarakina TaxID=272918 RepID=A0A2T0YR37_9MICC|nr:sugar-binding domain-containing protein [Nesterenkonia sandarakina]PRZ17848.1 DNA-binding transcriptional regulator LsrR (DeoR family) [Nesterenkonia sandarakina]
MAADHLVLLATIATEHFREGLSKVEIARRHDVSRFQVARLLDEALAKGIVRITIEDPTDPNPQFAGLRESLGINSVTVAPPRPDELMRPALARHAAALLPQRLHEGGRLGVAWSRTLMHLPEFLSGLPRVDVVQLVGALSAPGTSTAASSALIHSVGASAGGEGWPLPTPLIMDTAESAAALRGVAEVSAALKAADELDVAVVAIGAWGPGTSTFWDRLNADEQVQAQKGGVVSECSGILMDVNGEIALSGMEDRVIGVRPEQLRRAHVVAVAAAVDHPEAVIAAVRAGFVDDLVVPAELAARLVDKLGNSQMRIS